MADAFAFLVSNLDTLLAALAALLAFAAVVVRLTPSKADDALVDTLTRGLKLLVDFRSGVKAKATVDAAVSIVKAGKAPTK